MKFHFLKMIFNTIPSEMVNKHQILVRKPERKRTLEDLGIEGRIILDWFLGK
jgi:DNA-directed RNA polymerase subunit H (RpoH/RPB5)